MDIEDIARQIVDSAIRLHRMLGPGLLESTYQACMAHELRKRSLRVECEVPQPVHYDGIQIETGYRIDMVVEGSIIIENKACDALLPIHEAQLMHILAVKRLETWFSH